MDLRATTDNAARRRVAAGITGGHDTIGTVGVILLLCTIAAPVLAGGIAGTIRDATTQAPLSGIDLDLFDAALNPVTGVNGHTDASGAYLLTPVPAGDYYLRADPTTAQGYVDRYYPGVFLKSQATTFHVGDIGTVIIDFALERGATISGRITDAGSGQPLANMDLDTYAWDDSYISSINAKSATDGTFTVGCFPVGTFYVRVDPAVTDPYVIDYYNGKRSLSLADPIQVSGVGNIPNVDFSLVRGGTIAGTIRAQDTNAPMEGVDLDVFDAAGNFVSYSDAASAADGTYILNAVEPGDYYVQADPTAAQGHVDTYYPGTFDMALATLIHVAPGSAVSGIDIGLPLGGTISGRVTSATTGLPVANARITVFDAGGHIVSAFGSSTLADGSYLVGAMPSGTYYLRSAGDAGLGLAYEFYGGVPLLSQAAPVTATVGTDNPNRNIALDPGWWIAGQVLAGDTHQSLPGVDLDVYVPSGGERLGALGTVTDGGGAYLIGPVPSGRWIVRADPSKLYSYMPQYYDHVAGPLDATSLTAPVGSTISGVDFDVIHLDATDVPDAIGAGDRLLIGASPNPAVRGTTISLELPRPEAVSVSIHDVTGREKALLVRGSLDEGRHDLLWTGRDGSGRPVARGIYFVRVTTPERSAIGKILVLH